MIGGALRGLWSGGDGVVLRLNADGVDTLLTIGADGPFAFSPLLEHGAAYVVSVVSTPSEHTCVIASGAAGTIAEGPGVAVDLACAGPNVNVSVSTPAPFAFDRTIDRQSYSVSILAQRIAITVSDPDGLLDRATVGGVPVVFGTASTATALATGATSIPITVYAKSGLSKTYELAIDRGTKPITQSHFVKATDPHAQEQFGMLTVIDGDTMAISAPYDNSSGRGVYVANEPVDQGAMKSGAVYVFRRTGTTWVREAFLKASNSDAGDSFGLTLALVGNTLAITSEYEASAATGVDGDQDDNSAPNAGAVYVFNRDGSTWTQTAYLKASNTDAEDAFGDGLALSSNESLLVVSAPSEASNGVGVNPSSQSDNSMPQAGALYVFQRDGATWTQTDYLKPSNTKANMLFGVGPALKISDDTIVVGAPYESSNATGVDPPGGQDDTSAVKAGAAYVFRHVDLGGLLEWRQEAYLKASNTGAGDQFGTAAAISGDDLVIGAPLEASAAIGIDPDGQADNSAPNAGAAYAYHRTGGVWGQTAYLKASNASAGAEFGFAMAFSSELLVVAAPNEASSAPGIDPPSDEIDNRAPSAGAVYLFDAADAGWQQAAYIKAASPAGADLFGSDVWLSDEGLLVGAPGESSSGFGLDPPDNDFAKPRAGAGYVFE